jgi:DNA topoisomerase-1
VNAYLREISGEDFTAKDFRTWAGTVMAARALRDVPVFRSKAEATRNIGRAIESVAQSLGNTKTVCRKSYVHPAVLEAYMNGGVRKAPVRAKRVTNGRPHALTAEERGVVAILEAHVAAHRAPAAA